MYFQLSAAQESELLNQPETGMGYQVVEARRGGSYTQEKFLVLNSEVVVEMNSYEADNVRKIISEGIYSIKASVSYITLNANLKMTMPLNATHYPAMIKSNLLFTFSQ